jgi:hypothetical protein
VGDNFSNSPSNSVNMNPRDLQAVFPLQCLLACDCTTSINSLSPRIHSSPFCSAPAFCMIFTADHTPTLRICPSPLYAANVLDWKFFVAYVRLKRLEGKTGYAIEFSCFGFNCFRGSFSDVKFRHAPARRASFSSVVAGPSYHRGCLSAGESREEVNSNYAEKAFILRSRFCYHSNPWSYPMAMAPV